EVGQRPREAVDLVDHDNVDAAIADVLQEPLEPGPVDVAAGVPAVVVLGRNRNPSLVLLALDVVEAGLALGVERVERLFQALFTGLARVDRAADRCAHDRPPCFFSALDAPTRSPTRLVNPKNRSPDWWVPVISRASWVRLRYVRSR